MPDTILGCPREWLESDPVCWYIVFCDSARRAWWDVAFHTRSGFSHVYALRWDGYNWLLMNPGKAFTEVAILPGTSENALHSLLEPNATVIEVEAFRTQDRIRGRWWGGPMTCVEQVKALLGLPVGRIWTPWQLYRYLMENCTDGHSQKSDSSIDVRTVRQTENARADCSGKRTRTAPTHRARRINTRGK